MVILNTAAKRLLLRCKGSCIRCFLTMPFAFFLYVSCLTGPSKEQRMFIVYHMHDRLRKWHNYVRNPSSFMLLRSSTEWTVLNYVFVYVLFCYPPSSWDPSCRHNTQYCPHLMPRFLGKICPHWSCCKFRPIRNIRKLSCDLSNSFDWF